MKFIDLFSGIGGFRSALEKNGHECIGFSEIDNYAIQSYKTLYNTEGEIELGDITKVSDEEFKSLKGKVDLVVGGSPCQSFSNTGLKRGFEDTRGTLFFDYARVVKHIQPKMFLYENVKGLIAHDKMNTIKIVLETFDELGYYIDFHIFNSKFYDVPQNRERIYIVGKRKDLVDNPILHDRAKGRRRIVDVQNWARENISFAQLMPPLKDEVTTQLSDVLEDYVDKKYFLRDDYLERVRKQITENERKPLRIGEPNRVAGIWNSPQAGSVFDVRGISRSLDTSMGGYREPIVLLEGEQINARKITPLEAWRLQGFTDEQFKKVKDVGMSDWQLYIQAGNAVTVNVVDYIVKHILK